MIPCRAHDSLLALLGITAIAVYVLACRPSFSPDGTKVAFPVIDTEAKTASVMYYDLRTKTVGKIFEKVSLPEIQAVKATIGQLSSSPYCRPTAALLP